MQNALQAIDFAAPKLYQYSQGNLIELQNLSEKLKPFVSLKLLSANSRVKLSQPSLMPASGQAIITYLISGQALYADSTGKSGVLTQDGWSWIISGEGILTTLEPLTTDFLAIQLCIALTPAVENSLPQSAYVGSDAMERDGPAQVLIGWHGNSFSRFALPSLINYLVVNLRARQSWSYELPTNHQFAWVLVLRGAIETTEGEITANKITMLKKNSEKIRLCAMSDAIFVLGSSQLFMHDLICTENSVHTSKESLQIGQEKLARLARSSAK